MKRHLNAGRIPWSNAPVLISLIAVIVLGCAPVELDSPDERRYEEARTHYKAERYEEAAEGLRTIIHDHPYSIKLDDSRYWLGRTLLRLADGAADTSRKVDYAVEALEAFAAIGPKSRRLVDALYYANWTRMEIGELAPARYTIEEIVSEYDRLAAAYPRNERAIYSLLAAADVLGEHDRDSAALQRYRRVTNEYRNADAELVADAFNGMADSRRHLGDCVSALAYYDSAMTLDADTSAMRTALYWSGRCSLEAGDTAAACTALNGLVAYSRCSDTTGAYLPNAMRIRAQIGCQQTAVCIGD